MCHGAREPTRCGEKGVACEKFCVGAMTSGSSRVLGSGGGGGVQGEGVTGEARGIPLGKIGEH